LPQLTELLLRSKQAPLHTAWPAGQLHLPATHEAPVAQVFPHAPQLFVSVPVFTHLPLHRFVFGGQPHFGFGRCF
jgi:hypothetical protein